MTQVLIDRATLEQVVAALEDSIDCVRHEYETYWGHGLPTRKAQIDRMKESLDKHEAAITAGRAALADAESVQQVPDMFWNHDDAETLYGSIDEFLNDEICNGTPLEVGDVRVIQRAMSMPKVQIRITAVHDEECEADYVEEPYVKDTL